MKHDQAVTELTNSTTGWEKSPYSKADNDCFEINKHAVGGWIGVRDSKLGDQSPVLAFTESEWDALRDGIRDGLL